jgi:hypothetical protein
MKRIETDKYCYFGSENEQGWKVALQRAIYGTRVIVFYDNISIEGNYCGGANPEMVKVLFKRMYQWLDTNPENVAVECRKLHESQTRRPIGESEEFMNALAELPATDKEPQYPERIFELKPAVW